MVYSINYSGCPCSDRKQIFAHFVFCGQQKGNFADALLCNVTSFCLHEWTARCGRAAHPVSLRHENTNTGGAPTLSAEQFSTWVIDDAGRKHETRIYPHLKGLPRNYTRAIDLLAKAGGVITGTFGDAHCEVCDAHLLDTICRQELRLNPRAFLA